MKIHHFHHNIFYFLVYASYVLYVLSLLKFVPGLDKYSLKIHYGLIVYISLFLLYEFNPFRKTVFTDFHKEIVFHSGLILFGTTALATYFFSYVRTHKQHIEKEIEKL